MKYNLFVNYYNDKVQERTDELNFCFLENLKNNLFSNVVVICTKEDFVKLYKLVNQKQISKHVLFSIGNNPLWNKIKIIISEKRPCFNDYFKAINSTFPEIDNVNIIANLDIIIPQSTLVQSELYVAPDKCLALTRYDSNSVENYIGDSIYLNHPDSQDSWFFNGKVKEIDGATFTLGLAGCDNKIAYMLSTEGYEVSNPSYGLKTYHLHLTGVRNYGVRDEDRLQPPFLILQPTN
jgi:hypothetical protein